MFCLWRYSNPISISTINFLILISLIFPFKFLMYVHRSPRSENSKRMHNNCPSFATKWLLYLLTFACLSWLIIWHSVTLSSRSPGSVLCTLICFITRISQDLISRTLNTVPLAPSPSFSIMSKSLSFLAWPNLPSLLGLPGAAGDPNCLPACRDGVVENYELSMFIILLI